ncbi:hypothetical protein [Chromobacterium haemolyticum]|uniref:hypothetical protein n=1 Tax=Chromobacterium haemolyticum TaxID=394935 RepID=UPI0011312B8B|nr:hypothetical protein [Chromobacterium haemolyticum]
MDTRVVLHYKKIQPNLANGEIYIAREGVLDFDSIEEAKEYVQQHGITAAQVSGAQVGSEFFNGRDWIEQRLAKQVG